MSRRRGAFALVLLCSLLGAACGGGDSTTAKAAAPALTKEAYVQQANAICTKMNEKVDALADPGEDPAAVAKSLGQMVTIVDNSLDELRALPAPAGDEATLRAAYSKVDTMLADAIALGDAIKAGNEEKYEALQTKIQASSDAANAASNAYGLTVCGEE